MRNNVVDTLEVKLFYGAFRFVKKWKKFHMLLDSSRIRASFMCGHWNRPCLKRKKSRFGVEKLKKVFTFGKVLKSRTGRDFFFRGKHGLGQIHKSNEEKKDFKILIKSEIIIHFSQKNNRRIMISFFIFCENYEGYHFVITLVFLKKTVVKKKKKVGSILRFWKKVFTFSFFFRIFCRNGNHNSNEKS